MVVLPTRADEPTADVPPGESVHPQELLLAANTEIHLRTVETVASNLQKRGRRFRMEAAEPVIIDGIEVIGKGARGEGEVIHSERAGMGGRPGELIVAARFIRAGDRDVTLKSFTVGVGKDRLNLAMGVGATLGLPGLFIRGKDIVIPAGSDVFARVATDVFLPPLQSKELRAEWAAQSAEVSREYKNDDSSQQ
ncbi:MAG TPA: hypothetical protein VFS24_01975 [Steroidobacteraceae bacterium]|nr:hypothetical protein [Steroidobacteraceae bacterium]